MDVIAGMVYAVGNEAHALTPDLLSRPRGEGESRSLPSPAAVGEGLGVRERELVAKPMNHSSYALSALYFPPCHPIVI